MSHPARNFLTGPRLHVGVVARRPTCGSHPLFALRSLPSLWADAIPGRYSSSSLPPSFVSGRFAGLCLPAQRAFTAAGV